MTIGTAIAELKRIIDIHDYRTIIPVNREILKGVVEALNNAEEKKPTTVKKPAKKTTTRTKKV